MRKSGMDGRGHGVAMLLTALMLAQSLTYLPLLAEDSSHSARNAEVFIDGGEAWPQFGQSPGREAGVPAHSPDGGAGEGAVENVTELGSILNPTMNWRHFDESDDGVDAFAVPVADFAANIEVQGDAAVRCGQGRLSAVMLDTRSESGGLHGYLSIVDGDSSQTMWEVDLGLTDPLKAAPVVLDVDADGDLEIVVAYDANDLVTVEMWSPEIACSETGWTPGGNHETERLWRWSHDSLSLGMDGPYTGGIWGGHEPVAQPLMADLALDGSPELVLALYDDANNEPNVLALPLADSGTPSALWEVTLGQGTHPSDPAWVQLDEVSAAVVLTTIDYDSGNMWAWKLDGETGSPQWNGATISNLDGGTDAPHIRLPGPVIAELDGDAGPEMVITIPTDLGGSTTSDGATFVGLEVTDASEVWSFSAVNGYADAPPLPLDTDDDGEVDRVCWVTWFATTTDRHGVAGCTRVDTPNPITLWHRDLERSSGNLNDEIAVSPPSWMDIDGVGAPELLIAYGRTLHAFDGDEGTAAAINIDWINGIELDHRTWAAPTMADVDGDGMLDVLIGDMLISHASPDLRPFPDGRAIQFSPSTPDPGETVTVTGYFENVGTAATEEDTYARMYVDGAFVAAHTQGAMQPTAPSGQGSFASFSFDWSGGLGEHTFELRLDEHGNVSQTRVDNDVTVTTLDIVAPYAMSIGVPSEAIRVDPGGSEHAQPLMTSTGRLAGAWTLTIDDSNLPENWTVSDETPGGSTGINIDVGQTWQPTLRIAAPASALGTDDGWIRLTMTLDSDANISQTAVLPIEANRTRGISVHGPSGTPATSGDGIPGQTAMAWFLLENLGNAHETVMRTEWNSTAWGNDLTLHELDGAQVGALTLNPGEKRELVAWLDVPSSAAHGTSVSTPLTLCIGTGADEDCRTIDLTFVSNGVAIQPSHIRSTPTDGLTWQIEASLPTGVSSLSWDMAEGGMVLAGWNWSASGGLSISGTTLTASGNPGAGVTGQLHVDLPYAAPPTLHGWTMEAEDEAGHRMTLSLQVLQIYRADLEITTPTTETMRMNVSETNLIMLKLQNPGNGPDDFELSWRVESNANFSEDPGITVGLASSTYSLGAGGLTSAPVQLTLPEDMAAEKALLLTFEFLSLGDVSVYDTTTIELIARQDHRWEFTLVSHGDGDAMGSAGILMHPDETASLQILARNVGNHADDITLQPALSIMPIGDDDGSGWSATGDASGPLAVNGTALLDLSVSLDALAWNGTVAHIDFEAHTLDTVTDGFDLTVTVGHAPGWWVRAGGADLDIARGGENISLLMEQVGNTPAQPFVQGWVDAPGWTVNISQSLPVLNPGETTPMTIEVIPPENAISGHTVELSLLTRNGDGSGASTSTLPLRVTAHHQFSIDSADEWSISPAGGLPLVMLTNDGNAPTTLQYDLIGAPSDWQFEGAMQTTLAVGESDGIELDAVPPADWDGAAMSLTLRVSNDHGQSEEVVLTLTQRDRSWASSPVLYGMADDVLFLQFHPALDATSASIGGTALASEDGLFLWTVPSQDGEGTVSVDGVDLAWTVRVQTPPTRVADCSIAELDEIPLASCTIDNGTEALDWTAILRDDAGEMIDHASGHLAANVTGMVNLSAGDWEAPKGIRTLRITLLDGHGNVLADETVERIVRDVDWNLGIKAVEVETGVGERTLIVSMERSNHSKVADANCRLSLTAGTWSADYDIDVASTIAPRPRITLPDVDDIKVGVTVYVAITCDEPWTEDEDASDDSGSVTIIEGVTTEKAELDMAMLVATAAIVIGVGYLGGFITPRPEGATRKKRKAAPSKKATPKARAAAPRDEAPAEDDDDDMFLGDEPGEHTPASEAAETPAEESPSVDEDIADIAAAVGKAPKSAEDEFESRLSRLRAWDQDN